MSKLLTALKFSGPAAFGLLGLAVLFFSLPSSGWQALSVQTGSMQPAISPGDLVLTRRVAAGQLEIGDVVTYGVPGQRQTITHRIVGITGGDGQPRQFTVRGDANPSVDPPVFETQIVGRAIKIVPGLGRLTDALRSPLGLLILIYLPALSVVVGEIRRLQAHYQSQQRYTSPFYRKKVQSLRRNSGFLARLSISLVIITTTALPALAAMQATATLTGNTISAANAAPPSCSGSNDTSIIINNNTTQTSTSGDVSANNSTNSNSATSGNASNSNSTEINIDIC